MTQLSYPGVYVREVPGGVRTITGVATSITAFIGRAARGPVGVPRRITSYGDFDRIYGGLWTGSTLGHSVRDFYLNGGSQAVIVRLFGGSIDDNTAEITFGTAATEMVLEAASPGSWGNDLTASIDRDVDDPTDDNRFNLTVRDGEAGPVETFRNVSIDPDSARRVDRVLAQRSQLVRLGGDLTDDLVDVGAAGVLTEAATGGDDGDELELTDYDGNNQDKQGIYALNDADLINMLVVPPYTDTGDIEQPVRTLAAVYAKERDAVFIADPPKDWVDVDTAETEMPGFDPSDENVAVYFPRVLQSDPLRDNQVFEFAPSGAVAGVIARTDATRGVWKAPAGLDAGVRGVVGPAVALTDLEIGRLNPLGLNCIRTAPVGGHVVWGARTARGSDRLASEWKYLPVRRTALFLKVSLYRGTQWVVFEPNDEPLWAQIRLNVGAFMHNLFRQGAFAGTTTSDAYFVKCDSETTTQDDVNLGVVNILVGFAPLKPAEFVVISLQQMAGQTGGE